jgi:signal transduction histidine kinase/CheY-like chemotaxis protein/HPt (histidine-containing phosphotransfer) domain-containing protein
MTPHQPAENFWLRLGQLFSVLLRIDSQDRVVAMSPLVARFLGPDTLENKLSELFEFKRPTQFDGTYQGAMGCLGQLVLGSSKETGFGLRAQFQDYTAYGLDGLCLIGVPWLWWMQENNPDHGLSLRDFPVLDIQMDQLFFVSAQQTMVTDLEALNQELQMAQQLLEDANQKRQQFFSHVSHEMRTPLNGVISALTLIKDGTFDERTTKFLKLAAHSANRLLEIINFSLDTVSPQLDEADGAGQVFNMDRLLDECIAVTQSRALEKDLRLERRGQSQFPQGYQGHPRLLKQVLINLIGNAIKFTQDGDVLLFADLKGYADDGNAIVEFRVEDQGPGIPEEVQARIFEPFATGVTLETQKEQGTGLGLNIAKRCVETMGGALCVSSELGNGAIFSFSVAFPELSDEQAKSLLVAAEERPLDRLSGSILVVDNQEPNLSLNAQVLTSLGVTVETASSGAAALELLKSKTYDVVLMDLDMPGMSGYEATRAIREIHTADAQPVLALTAHTDGHSRQQAMDAGMQGFIEKPMLRDKLLHQLGSWLTAPGSQGAQQGTSVSLAEEATREPVFVASILERMQRDVGANVVEALVSKFLSESSARWDVLQAALSLDDLPIISREAHTLGSSCFTFGLQSAGNQFRRLEAEANAGAIVALDIESLAADLGEGITELERLIGVE